MTTRSLPYFEKPITKAYVRYMDLVKDHGKDVADAIRARKHELQLSASPADDPWWMAHPELPGNQA